MLLSVKFSYALRQLEAIHHGHAKVCKDDAVPHSVLVRLFNLIQGLFPVDTEVGLKVCVDA